MSASSRFQAQSSEIRIPPPAVTSLTIRTPAAAVPPNPVPNQQQLSEAYFPTPSQKMGQWWKKVTHNYPFYAQQGAADCGAACIVMVGQYWGKEFNINRLRELAYVSRDGASLKGLTNAVEALGFNCRPVKASLALLAKQRMPAIAHWQGNHYIVVFEITPQQIIICDPAIGQRKLTHAEFMQGWTGYCLLLEPTLALKQKQAGKSTRYNRDADKNILENISFEIKPGQTVAIVGRSGSGKTTLAKLLLGLHLPTSGTISIDGKDLTTISLHSLRSQAGIVDRWLSQQLASS